MTRRSRSAVLVGALLLAAILAAVAARRVTVLVLDVPEHRATLLVKRSQTLDMRLVESESSLCGRQSPGSPLHSLHLPPTFCPLALASGPLANGPNVLLKLPFSRLLHRSAG